MLNNKTIAVVIPAYNEETQIKRVIDTLPKFVDRIVVINDNSSDSTRKIVEEMIRLYKLKDTIKRTSTNNLSEPDYGKADKVKEEIEKKEKKRYPQYEMSNSDISKDRLILLNHIHNYGKGAGVITGYNFCRQLDIDCTAVMDGDGQMDPSELQSICEPIVKEGVDYVKGNRLKHRSAFFVIPKIRYFGNSVLSLLTKVASGYWRVSDTQTGYTAISLAALNSIRIYDIYKSYGYPNDLLVKLNIAFCSLKEVEIKPVYDIGEKSKMKIWKVIPTISFLLVTSFLKRLFIKYLFRDFHPLFLLYTFGMGLLLVNIPFFIEVIKAVSPDYLLPNQTLLIFMFLTISGFQSLFFAMWMDMMDNERLYK